MEPSRCARCCRSHLAVTSSARRRCDMTLRPSTCPFTISSTRLNSARKENAAASIDPDMRWMRQPPAPTLARFRSTDAVLIEPPNGVRFHAGCRFSHIPQKEDPGTRKGPGSIRRMGEGLGGWGHATRRLTTQRARPPAPFLSLCKIIFGSLLAPARRVDGARARPLRQIGRQTDLPAIGKFKISQVDTAAAALDDVAGTDREAARKTTGPCELEPLNSWEPSCGVRAPRNG